MAPSTQLVLIKLAHTVIWAVMAGAIFAIPVAALTRRFRLAAWLSALVLLECAVLVINGGRCPLTDLADRFTAERAANFDIYLPQWLARNNKQIFGTLFVMGEVVLAWRWRSR